MAAPADTLGSVPLAPAAPATAGLAAGTRALLEAPIPGTLLRLAAPNVVVITVQAAITVLEAVYVGWLGRDALARADLGLGTAAAAGHRRRRRRGGELLCRGQPRPRRGAALATQPREALGARCPPARGVVPRHPPGGAAGRAQHDPDQPHGRGPHGSRRRLRHGGAGRLRQDRKSTRLNSSHMSIS